MSYTRRVSIGFGYGSATASSGGHSVTATDNNWKSFESESATARYSASPDEGYAFMWWLNDGGEQESTDNPYNLNHANTISLRAVFQAVNVCKLVYDANGGTGAPATQSYEQVGTADHTFTVSSTTPTKSGYTFIRWLDNEGHWRDPGDSVKVAYNETLTLTAYWQANPVITLSAGTGGSVQPGSLTVAYGSIISVNENTITVDEQTATATANAGYSFSSWSNTSGLVTSDRTVSASFSEAPLTITASAGSGGSISPSGSVSVSYGADKSFSISANSNYRISTLKVDGTNVSGVSGRSSYTYTFSNVTADHTIEATFYYDPPTTDYTVYFRADPSAGGTFSQNSLTFPSNTNLITISPLYPYRVTINGTGVDAWANDGYQFTGWSVSNGDYASNGQTIYAYFANTATQRVYTVGYGVNGTATVNGNSSSATVNIGDTVTYKATPNQDYKFQKWVDSNGIEVSTSATYSFTASTEGDSFLYAYFEEDMPTYMVTFDPVGGAVSPASKTVTYGQAYGADGVWPTPTKEGFTFIGWYTEETGGMLITANHVVNRRENHTLYAHWSDVYATITIYRGIRYAEEDNYLIEGVNLRNGSIDTTTVPGMTFKDQP